MCRLMCGAGARPLQHRAVNIRSQIQTQRIICDHGRGSHQHTFPPQQFTSPKKRSRWYVHVSKKLWQEYQRRRLATQQLGSVVFLHVCCCPQMDINGQREDKEWHQYMLSPKKYVPIWRVFLPREWYVLDARPIKSEQKGYFVGAYHSQNSILQDANILLKLAF